MSLLALQRSFGAWLRDGGNETAALIGAAYRPGLDVYLNNYRAQLFESLSASFALVLAWTGEDAFHDAVVTHIDRVPPSGWTLDAYGRDFPATLASLFPDEPEIAELARIEWALSEAFVAPDHDLVDPASLAGVDWDRAVLHFSPAIQLVDVSTNVFELWSALAGEIDPPPAEPLIEPQALIVFRTAQVCRVRLLEAGEAAAIRLCLAGATFSALCGALVESWGEERGVAQAGAFLGHWVAEGLVAEVTCFASGPKQIRST